MHVCMYVCVHVLCESLAESMNAKEYYIISNELMIIKRLILSYLDSITRRGQKSENIYDTTLQKSNKKCQLIPYERQKDNYNSTCLLCTYLWILKYKL